MSTPTRRKLSKPGRHGMLYRFRLTYGDDEMRSTWDTWAYDADHASERFHDDDFTDGWEIFKVEALYR